MNRGRWEVVVGQEEVGELVKEEVKNEVRYFTDPEHFLVCGHSRDFRFRLLIEVDEDDGLAADLGGVEGGVTLMVVALLPLSLSLPRSNSTSFSLIIS